MEQRRLGSTGRDVSVVGLGTWQLGSDWGDVTEGAASEVLDAATAAGVTLIDTADVYGDGRSETLIGAWLAEQPEGRRPLVATKMGRRQEQQPENYTWENFVAWNERSRRNLGMDTLDLVQLHCPPTAVLESGRVYDDLARMVDKGWIAAYGVSVETCEQALLAMEHGVASVQIILNVFRRKPLDEVLPRALERGVGIIARVPLASGLLSGRYSESTTFPAGDHRTYNRHGEAFDRGETFSGVDYDAGVEAARAFAGLVAELGPEGATPAQVALRWIIDRPGVTSVIPGARDAEQARANADAAALPPLGSELDAALEDLYDRSFRTAIHHQW